MAMYRYQYFTATPAEKAFIKEKIANVLNADPDVLSAHLFGSFLSSESVPFRDIDVGLFVAPAAYRPEDDYLRYEYDMEQKIYGSLGHAYPVDVHVLNHAPLVFMNNVLSKGEVISTQDEPALVETIERTGQAYLANEPFAAQSIREVLSAY